jgi:predicted transcriptional regulator
MKTSDAVAKVLLERGLSKYALAKSLNVFPVSINQWLKGTRMSERIADEFERLYKIKITNTVPTSTFFKPGSTDDTAAE